jgi:hypothetical protein
MTTHDPQKIIEDLRNHLTQHDTRIAFLLGAGASSAVQVPIKGTSKNKALIPTVLELTSLCAESVKKLDTAAGPKRGKFSSAWDLLAKEAKPPARDVNIEDILTLVRRKLDGIGADTLVGLSKSELIDVDETIRKTIAQAVDIGYKDFPEELPHYELGRWIARIPRKYPVEIFTTNYDLIIEHALEAEWVPLFDGFVGCYQPFFNHDSLYRAESAPASSWARLWKIHGSINWTRVKIGNHERFVRGCPTHTGELILPSHYKYDEARKQPYAAFLERLGRVLEYDDAILITIGYSFGDDHINAVIFDALQVKPRPHVFSLHYLDPDEKHIIVTTAKNRLNLMVLGPKKAVITGVTGEWRLTSAVDNRTAPFMDIAFDSDALDPTSGVAESLTGKLRLGDFNYFCKFLQSMFTT